MITKDKVTDIFCIIDEFDKNFVLNWRKIFCGNSLCVFAVVLTLFCSPLSSVKDKPYLCAKHGRKNRRQPMTPTEAILLFIAGHRPVVRQDVTFPYFLALPCSTFWSSDAVLREGVMPCCMERWRSTSSAGQPARRQDGRICPWKKEEEKRGFGTGKTVLSTISLHYQQVTVTVTGAVQTFLKYNKK